MVMMMLTMMTMRLIDGNSTVLLFGRPIRLPRTEWLRLCGLRKEL